MPKSIFYHFLRTRNIATFLYFYRKYVLLLASIIVHFLTLSISKIEFHLSNKIFGMKNVKHLRKKIFEFMQKICFFAPTRYAPSRLHQVNIAPSRCAPSRYCTKLICTKSMHQVDVRQVDCTKSTLHQVDTAPSRHRAKSFVTF